MAFVFSTIVKSIKNSHNSFFKIYFLQQKLFLFCISIFFLFFTSSCSFKNKETLTVPSVAAIDNTVNPGDGGGGGGGGDGGSTSGIHGPLAPITAISLSVTSAATTSLYAGLYTMYSSAR